MANLSIFIKVRLALLLRKPTLTIMQGKPLIIVIQTLLIQNNGGSSLKYRSLDLRDAEGGA